MASYNNYTGNGETTQYPITFPYIDQSHVVVFLDGVETVDWDWFDSSTIEFTEPPGAGVAIRIQRVTPVSERLAEFTNGEALLDEELNVAVLQSLYASEEAKDRAEQSIAVNNENVYDFGGRRATNLAEPEDEDDAVTKAYADNIIEVAAGHASDAEDAAIAAANSADSAANSALAAAQSAQAAAQSAQAAAQSAADAEAAAQSLNTNNLLKVDQNLADLANAATARTNLGLGNAATKDVATAAEILAKSADKLITVADAWAANSWVNLGTNLNGNVVINANLGNKFFGVLNGNATVFVENLASGQTITLVLLQDNVGSRTISWNSNIKWPNGNAPTISTTANSIAIVATLEGSWDPNNFVFATGWKVS